MPGVAVLQEEEVLPASSTAAETASGSGGAEGGALPRSAWAGPALASVSEGEGASAAAAPAPSDALLAPQPVVGGGGAAAQGEVKDPADARWSLGRSATDGELVKGGSARSEEQAPGHGGERTRSVSTLRLSPRMGRRGSQAAMSIFEAMQRKAESQRCPMLMKMWTYSFHPKKRFRRTWDMLVLVLVMFSVWWEPYNAAFNMPDRAPNESLMMWWEWVVDACFYADMVLSFWTGYDTGYTIVTEKSEIAKRYLSGWFLVRDSSVGTRARTRARKRKSGGGWGKERERGRWSRFLLMVDLGWLAGGCHATYVQVDLAATIEWDVIVSHANDHIVDMSHMALTRMIKVARLGR
eukprot:COSAG01_NODE_12728_length_1693_cov_1.586575_1_plen_352_part_00